VDVAAQEEVWPSVVPRDGGASALQFDLLAGKLRGLWTVEAELPFWALCDAAGKPRAALAEDTVSVTDAQGFKAVNRVQGSKPLQQVRATLPAPPHHAEKEKVK